MKKCPNCERTFDDGMRFCQTDGTPLVDDAPALDPYKTMVAKPGEIAAAMSSADEPVPAPHGADDVLQLPNEPDPLKTMYASEDEIRKEMRARDADQEQVIDIPPLAPEPPKFSEPSLSPPSFGDASPPPSPFSSPSAGNAPGDNPFQKSSAPIPSPFDPKPAASEPPPPANFPQFHDPEPPPSASANPFDQPSSAMPEWTPPTPAMEPSQKNEPMQNAPYPPAAGAAGQNKTLAIISLVVGILGFTLCCGSFLPSVVAIVLGFMAKGKASSDPAHYGGSGLAMGGIITGVLGLLLSVAVIALYMLGFMASMIPNAR